MEKQKFSFTVYHADQFGKPQNCLYPHEGTATTAEELKPLLCNDHVFIRFRGNYRSKSNFVQAITATFDCDNDHSDEPSEWIKPEDMPVIFPGVRCFTDTSRHHMKQKGGRSPRPRFHVTFETDSFTDPENYAAFMKKVQGMYRFFDDGALDAARFFFGNPDAEIRFFPGTITLTEFLAEEEAARAFTELGESIPEGNRNNTLYKGAMKILKRWGDTADTYQRYLKLSGKCSPPLEDDELERICGKVC